MKKVDWNIKEGWVYFALVGNKVKIGKTKDLFERMESLYKNSPYKPKIIECFYCRHASKMEFSFHRYYKQYRAHGEWFSIPKNAILEMNFPRDILWSISGPSYILLEGK
jgi:hypothetical protein